MNGGTFMSASPPSTTWTLTDVYNVDDEKAKIDAYKQAYETTGTYAMKAMMMNGMSGDMAGSAMASAADDAAGHHHDSDDPPRP